MGESTPPESKAPSSKAIAAANDKRQFPRFKIEGTATVGQPGFLASFGLGGRKSAVINLSQGGSMIRVGKKLPMESRHDLHIEIPKFREVIVATGEVRWCLASAKSESDIYVGFMFVDLAPAERRKLAGMYELFHSQEYKAMAAVRKDQSSIRMKAPKF